MKQKSCTDKVSYCYMFHTSVIKSKSKGIGSLKMKTSLRDIYIVLPMPDEDIVGSCDTTFKTCGLRIL